MGKASTGNLVKGITFIAIGMALAYGIWNILVGLDVLYVSSHVVVFTELIPAFASLPGLIIYIIWYFNRKSLGERLGYLDHKVYAFAGFMIIAIGIDALLGVIGLVLSSKYVVEAAICWGMTVALQVIFCFLAFFFGPPYRK